MRTPSLLPHIANPPRVDFVPIYSVRAMASEPGTPSRVAGLDFDLTELLVGLGSVFCFAGPLVWMFVRYWVFAP
jgi:hypothetical protein